jgi:hypothetical protein
MNSLPYINNHVHRISIHLDPENPYWETCKSGASCTHCEFVCAEHQEYNDNLPKVVEHLLTAHKIVACEHCNTLYNKRSLKKHQAGLYCRAQKYKQEVAAQGFVRISEYETKRITAYFTKKYDLLAEQATSSDVAAMLQAQAAVAEAEQKFYRIMSKVDLFTHYRRGGWGGPTRLERESWVNKEMYEFLCLATKSDGYLPYSYRQEKVDTHWLSDAFPLLIHYVENPDERDSMVAILELARDMENQNV